MRKSLYLGAILAFAVFTVDTASAGTLSHALPAQQSVAGGLPFHLSSVICGAQGCRQATRVRNCRTTNAANGTARGCSN
jgi:hypothetical protein